MYATLITFFLLSIITSFLCSLWEAVLLSISPSYMQIQQNEGSRIGEIMSRFKANIDRPLAGILTLNTMAHTVGAVVVGQEAAKIWHLSNPVITGFVVPAVMTASILILSEIIPKTIGATNWRVLAPFTVRSLDIMIKVLAPLVWFCQLITGFFNRGKEASVFSRSDFMAMAEIGANEGQLNELEMDFIQNLLRFTGHKARDIMTPRTVLTAVPQDLNFREFYDRQDELTFSRIPLLESERDDSIAGYVLKDEVLESLIDGKGDQPLSSIRRDIIVVQESSNILALFQNFIKKREHIALVVDEYGSTMGLVTMEDIIETLLGTEIVDETDKIVDLQSHAKEHARYRFDNNGGNGGAEND